MEILTHVFIDLNWWFEYWVFIIIYLLSSVTYLHIDILCNLWIYIINILSGKYFSICKISICLYMLCMPLYKTLMYMSYNFYFLCKLIKTWHDNHRIATWVFLYLLESCYFLFKIHSSTLYSDYGFPSPNSFKSFLLPHPPKFTPLACFLMFRTKIKLKHSFWVFSRLFYYSFWNISLKYTLLGANCLSTFHFDLWLLEFC